MRIKATLKVKDETRSGTSMATGDPWTRKECVIEFSEEMHSSPHTIACTTSQPEVIAILDKAEPNDILTFDLHFFSEARTFQYKGKDCVERKTKAYIIASYP